MTSLQKLITGYAHFKSLYTDKQLETYRQTASLGQSPKSMIIACCDSRVDPLFITNASLGELFVFRNIANIVPPYTQNHNTHYSTGAALEYAVCFLKVEQIIIIGHSQCGGIKALIDPPPLPPQSLIPSWLQNLTPTKDNLIKNHPHAPKDKLQNLLEKEALIASLHNLSSYPFISHALKTQKIHTHAWHFDIPSGTIQHYLQTSKSFTPL